MDATIEKMIHVMSSIHKLQLSVKELEDSNELTVSYVKRECTKLEERLRNLDRVFQDVFYVSRICRRI